MFKITKFFSLFSLIFACIVFSASTLADHAYDDDVMLEVTEGMVKAAQEILATVANGPGGIENAVGYDRNALLGLEFNDEARENYVYWPYIRKGLPFDYMSAQQKALTHDLLHEALSAKGYLSAIQVMQMEEILADTEVIGFPRGTENYTLAIFGEPAVGGNWGWRFEGHHLSLNFTVAPGEVSVTPAFFGASPAKIPNGNLAGFRNQHEVHKYGYEFINVLSEQEQALAIQAENPPFDILSGNLNKPEETWNDWKNLPEIGINVSQVNTDKQAIIQRIIDEVITTYRPEISTAYLKQIDLNDLRFAWYGSTEEDEPHYYRIDGPDFFFEYDIVQGNGNHVHAVWRSKNGDFGEDLLKQHRQNEH